MDRCADTAPRTRLLLNPTSVPQVPLELRCAQNNNLTSWSGPEYLFWFYFNRNLPYDPVRPWKDVDGQWYATISADSCNDTVPCHGGGREYLYTSPAMRGPDANWTLLGPLFSSNWTVLLPFQPSVAETDEFVTAGYFGALSGDPRGGRTRCLTNNVNPLGGTTAYFCGTQVRGTRRLLGLHRPRVCWACVAGAPSVVTASCL